MPGGGGYSVLTSIDKNRISNLVNSHPKWSCAQIGKLAADRGSPEVDQSTVW